MCEVIVVDAGRSRSTCHGSDAYIHDHWLRYRHKYALFYQLFNSNLFSYRMLSLKREDSSENYGPCVYFYHNISRTIKWKTQKYLAEIYLLLSYFALLLVFCIYHYQISPLQVTVKGLTTPLVRWVQVFVCLRRCYHGRLMFSSYWIDTLVLNWGKYLSLLWCITLSLQGKNQRKLEK